MLNAVGPLALTGGSSSVERDSTSYAWDAHGRLATVTMKDGLKYRYRYDYRARRVGIERAVQGDVPARHTAVVFSGGLSLAEYESGAVPASLQGLASTVRYVRGPDMGGGVGGLLYSQREGSAKFNLSNGRGDVVAQSNAVGELTWTASYEAYGKGTKETGANADKQRANTKDEDPTGLLNEGFRYRDLETGVWLSRDPAGFVDGPNVYAYVQQNPWSAFDPKGLSGERVDDDGFKWSSSDHHKVPVQVARDAGWGKEAKSVFDNAKIKTPNGHNFTSHRAYNAEVSAEMAEFFAEKGVVKNGVSQIGGMSAKEQSALAQEFVDRLDNTSNKFIKGFNAAVPDGPGGVASWFAKEGKDIVLKSTGKVAMTKGARVVNGIAKTANIGGRLAKGVPLLGGLLVGFSSAAEGKDNNQIAKDVVMSSTGADIAQWAIEENPVVKGATTIIENRNKQLDNVAETLGLDWP